MLSWFLADFIEQIKALLDDILIDNMFILIVNHFMFKLYPIDNIRSDALINFQQYVLFIDTALLWHFFVEFLYEIQILVSK